MNWTVDPDVQEFVKAASMSPEALFGADFSLLPCPHESLNQETE
jgi:hypothetical protein